MSRHECDCGAVYGHPDLVIACAERGHGIAEGSTGGDYRRRSVRRPIATAPRDGTLVLIIGRSGYTTYREFAVSAYWSPEREQWLGPDNEPWQDCGWGDPTHWTEIPT